MYPTAHRSPRRLRIVTTAAAAALFGSVAIIGLAASPSSAGPTSEPIADRSAMSTPGACPTSAGVTVIIDFQEFEEDDSFAYIRCAPNAPSSGFEALEQAGIDHTPTTRSPGFLCRIAGIPAAGGTLVKSPKQGDPSTVSDACQVPSPTTAYWSYWLAPRGGSWCYSNFGAGNRKPPAGTVEGWSFVLNRSSSATPPPRIAPPPPLVGVANPSLPGKDCTVPTEGAPPTTAPTDPGSPTTRPKPGATTPTPGGPSNPSAPGSRPGNAGQPGSPAGPATGSGPGGSSQGSKDENTTSTTAKSGGSTSTTRADEDAAPGDDDSQDPSKPTGTEGSSSRGITDPEEIAALEGDIDLGDGGGSKGSPVPLIAAGVAAAGLVAGGVRQRRRSQASSGPT